MNIKQFQVGSKKCASILASGRCETQIKKGIGMVKVLIRNETKYSSQVVRLGCQSLDLSRVICISK